MTFKSRSNWSGRRRTCWCPKLSSCLSCNIILCNSTGERWSALNYTSAIKVETTHPRDLNTSTRITGTLMNSLFLFSALPDQAVTANKDKEPHGNGTQKDLAVIAGLFFSPLCCFIFFWLIENESQLFVICHSLHLPPSSLSTLPLCSQSQAHFRHFIGTEAVWFVNYI